MFKLLEKPVDLSSEYLCCDLFDLYNEDPGPVLLKTYMKWVTKSSRDLICSFCHLEIPAGTKYILEKIIGGDHFWHYASTCFTCIDNYSEGKNA